MNDNTLGAYNIADLRKMAKRRLPRGVFEFIDRGTEDEVALRNNRAAFDSIKLRPRVLVDVSKRSQEVTVFGQKQAMPIATAPTGAAGLAWFEAELAVARAARDAGIPFTLATPSLMALERVAAEAAGGRHWFQLYVWEDLRLSYGMIERAEAAGFEALLVTVDTVVSPNREYNLRNGFGLPFAFNATNITDVLLHPRWLFGVLARYVMTSGMPRYGNYPEEMRTKITSRRPMGRGSSNRQSFDWEELRAMRQKWRGRFVVKGVMRPDDAIRAADMGADGVVVSNHGGRNLDSAEATIAALPHIVDAVGHRVEVLIDSGFRRGSDVAKALALGAKAALVGRATLFGAAAAGEAGAARALAILRNELDIVLAYLGCPNAADLTPDCLAFADAPLRRTARERRFAAVEGGAPELVHGDGP
jgi:(S)-mandelate dehydrogenase